MEFIHLKYMGTAVYQIAAFLNGTALMQFKQFTGIINRNQMIPLLTSHTLAVRWTFNCKDSLFVSDADTH